MQIEIPRTLNHRRFTSHLPLLLLIGFLGACAEQKKTTTVQPEGNLPVLDTGGALSTGLAIGVLPQDWAVSGPAGIVKKRVSVVIQNGVKALKVETGLERFSIVRRTRAMLLATPYLNWSWNLSPHGPGTHPIRLIIGFRSGAKIAKTWTQPCTWNSALVTKRGTKIGDRQFYESRIVGLNLGVSQFFPNEWR